MWLLTPTKAAEQGDQAEAGSEYDASLRQIGVSDNDLAAAKKHADADGLDEAQTFKAWPWHLNAMRAFGAMRTQWRVVAGMAGLFYIGLDYSSWPVVKRELGLDGTDSENAGLFDQLQAMERGALPYRNRSLTA